MNAMLWLHRLHAHPDDDHASEQSVCLFLCQGTVLNTVLSFYYLGALTSCALGVSIPLIFVYMCALVSVISSQDKQTESIAI